MTWIVDIIENPIEGDAVIGLSGATKLLPLHGDWRALLGNDAALEQWRKNLETMGVFVTGFHVYEYNNGDWVVWASWNEDEGVTWLN